MQFRELLQLNDGTKIMYSRLKYSGVYFRCETPATSEGENMKYAMAVWPDDIEPLRFYDITGYTRNEIEVLRYHICKVGDMVLLWVVEELEEELNQAKRCLTEGNVLLVFDKQQAFGFVAGFINEGKSIQTLVPKTGVRPDYDMFLSLYDEKNEEIAVVNTMRDVIDVKLKRQGISYYLKNNGEQRLKFYSEEGVFSIEQGECFIL